MRGEDFLYKIESLRYEQLCVHDIKVKLKTNIHHYFVNHGYSSAKSNGLIIINYPNQDNNLTIKISVYPPTVQIDIGCTYKPLVFDTSSMWSLHELMSKISFHLTCLIKNKMELPPVHEWVITHFHLNKDGSDGYSGESFNFEAEEFNLGIFRFYSKHYLDGKTKLRLEKIKTPQNSIAEEMHKVLFQKAFELS